MRIDNFTTARCKECRWTKQFHPGKEYNAEDFKCDCKPKQEEPEIVKIKAMARRMGISFPANIGVDTLKRKIKENGNGN